MTTRNDLTLYERHADDWWDAGSRFAASLHGVNELVLAQIRERIGALDRGKIIVDLGCGGGLLAEPLARAGAFVAGIDLGARSLRVARAHAAGAEGAQSVRTVHYVRADARKPPVADGCADLVVCADVLEHIDGWQALLARAADLLAPGGACYVATVNRTWRSRWIAVGLGEGLGILPRGTHDPARFITPAELAAAADGAGMDCEAFLGQRLRWWKTLRSRRLALSPGKSLAMGYSAWLVKRREPIEVSSPVCLMDEVRS